MTDTYCHRGACRPGRALIPAAWLALCGLLIALLTACAPATPALLPTLAIAPAPTETATPRALIAWETLRGSLQPGQLDGWTFEAGAGETIRLRVLPDTERTAAGFTLALRDPAGGLLASGDDLRLTLPTAGQYRVEVGLVRGEGAYQLGLSYPDQPDPDQPTPLPEVVGVPTPTPPYADLGTFKGILAPGQSVSDNLPNADALHAYIYDAEAGELLNWRLMPESGAGLWLRLFDPRGRLLAVDASSNAAGGAALWNIRIGQPGIYTLQISAGGPEARSGGYQLSLSDDVQALTADVMPTPTPQPTLDFTVPTLGPLPPGDRLSDHVAVLGELARPSDFGRYSFMGQAGQWATVIVAPHEQARLRPQFEVYGPDGLLLTDARSSTSNARGAALAASFGLPEDGAYQVFVTSEDDTAGAYVISYGRGSSALESPPVVLAPDTVHNGGLEQAASRESFPLVLRTGDVITAAASPIQGSPLDPVLSLWDDTGRMIAQDDNGGGDRAALLRVVSVPRDGLYWLRVTPAEARQMGAYTLRWRYVQQQPTPTPVPQAATIVQLRDRVEEGAYAFYPFQGWAGQQIRVEVSALPGSSIDPVAVLLDPQGREIAQGDDSGGTLNADFVAALPDEGTYTLRVNGYLSGGAFAVRIGLLLE